MEPNSRPAVLSRMFPKPERLRTVKTEDSPCGGDVCFAPVSGHREHRAWMADYASLIRPTALSYWTSTIFGPGDSICALVAEGRFDGNAGPGNRKAASGGTPCDGRRATVVGSTITLAPTFTRS